MEPSWLHSYGDDSMEDVNMLMEMFKAWLMKLGNINPYCLEVNDYTLLGQKHTRVSQFWQITIFFQSFFFGWLKTGLKYEYLDDIENNFFSIFNLKSWFYKTY
jgi:hypothetical protein